MLEVSGLCAGYGRLPVLRDVSFSAAEGEILLIAGENGAGKTTLLQTIGGLIKPTAGSIRFEGRDVTGATPEDLVPRGLRLVLDGHRVFPELSVFDNIRLGAVASKTGKVAFDTAVDQIFEVFPILKQKANDKARSLSGGQQQMLTLSQAFVSQPKVLLCDEPSLGLAMALMPPIMNFLRSWAKSGTAVVIVEQHVQLALAVAARGLLMQRGSVVFDGTADEFAAETGIIAAPH
ncbi:ABC transporter ATP-binding protein [Oryzicola mucosus]|uniref:ABC transporter ATP-binding protein n=1 Tax=Oryzicola mucosus TaxID=2767425 RepID=A0A8J6Q5A4_9HYPH|nr:ABC transporter ATP-binding protein [Oryzicola mucosus]MBD0417350.1 ABC transporter ATP-binding protein [Oryzicola mucosus]